MGGVGRARHGGPPVPAGRWLARPSGLRFADNDVLGPFEAPARVHFLGQGRSVVEHVFFRAGMKPGDRSITAFDHVAVTARTALIQLTLFDPRDVVDGLCMPALHVGLGLGGRLRYCTHFFPPLTGNPHHGRCPRRCPESGATTGRQRYRKRRSCRICCLAG
jgi:hypothetical protein